MCGHQPLIRTAAALAVLFTLGACSSSKGTLQNPYQPTALQAPVTVIQGWNNDYSLDTPDTVIDPGMHLSAAAALARVDINASVRQALRNALERQHLAPAFIEAPTDYTPTFDVAPPGAIRQVERGSALVVGVKPEVLCVTSALERIRGTQDPTLRYPCSVVELKYSVQHYAADGSVSPPLVWRDTFTRSINPTSRCRDIASCTHGAVDALLNRLTALGLFNRPATPPAPAEPVAAAASAASASSAAGPAEPAASQPTAPATPPDADEAATPQPVPAPAPLEPAPLPASDALPAR